MELEVPSTEPEIPAAEPVDVVIFDFHGTLFDSRDPAAWIAAARRHSDGRIPVPGRPGSDVTVVQRHLHEIWTHAQSIDPSCERDLDADRHRDVFCRAATLCSGIDAEFALALYAVMAEQSMPFEDTLPVLKALRGRGLRTVLLSNIGWDVRPVLQAAGAADYLDDVVLSYEVGMIKPDPAIFALVLNRLGVSADRALMVGDSELADVGGVALGIRTLVLPRSRAAKRGLGWVLDLVDSRGPRPARGPDPAPPGARAPHRPWPRPVAQVTRTPPDAPWEAG